MHEFWSRWEDTWCDTPVVVFLDSQKNKDLSSVGLIICLKSFKNALTFITVYCFAQSVVEVSCHWPWFVYSHNSLFSYSWNFIPSSSGIFLRMKNFLSICHVVLNQRKLNFVVLLFCRLVLKCWATAIFTVIWVLDASSQQWQVSIKE